MPARFREVLQEHYTDALVITATPDSLVAYPPEVWQVIENKALELSQIEPQQRNFIRYYISGAERYDFDKQGRILIPPFMRERTGLGQEVLLAGMLTSIEIWDKGRWDEKMTWDQETYQVIAEKMADWGL